VSTAPRLLLVPRWDGTAQSAFYPWLIQTLREQIPSLHSSSVDLWPPRDSKIERATNAVTDAMAAPPHATHALAHSAGCLVLLRALATPRAQPLEATVLVAGWWTIDTPWPEIAPWTDDSFDRDRARRNAGRLIVLLSDNDPFTSDFRETARRFSEELDAEVRLVPGAGHFNASTQPTVLRALLDTL
jgi:predicted alpha/beta hydrolase family esterase